MKQVPVVQNSLLRYFGIQGWRLKKKKESKKCRFPKAGAKNIKWGKKGPWIFGEEIKLQKKGMGKNMKLWIHGALQDEGAEDGAGEGTNRIDKALYRIQVNLGQGPNLRTISYKPTHVAKLLGTSFRGMELDPT